MDSRCLGRSARALEQAVGDTVVRMACLDDGVNGRVLSSYLHTLQWDCVTSTDPGLAQAPLRAPDRQARCLGRRS
jgi:hypothetical protein